MAGLVILACFFVSGVSGLIYEICWIRRAALVFGATAPALGTVLAVFFGGLALGSWLGGRASQRTRRPLRWYGRLEIALAALAVGATAALGAVDAAYGACYRALAAQPVLLAIARPLLVAVALLPPTILMGATLPLLCRHFVTARDRIGASVGGLYALNTLGAAAGCAAAGFRLLPALGIWGCVALAAALNALAGGVVLALRAPRAAAAAAPRNRPASPRSPDAAAATPPLARQAALVGALFALTGLVALAGEVLWTRFLALLVRNSITTYTITLTVTLLGIVLGSALAARLSDRASRLGLAFGTLLAAGAVAVVTLVHLPPDLWRRLGPGLPTFLGLLLPPAVASGACLPVAVRLVLRDPELAAAGVGRLVALNTLGGIAGSVLASFVLLPALGLDGSLRLITGLGVVGGAVAMLALGRDTVSRRERLGRGALALVLAALWFAAPRLMGTRLPADYLAPRPLLQAWAEGQAATLAAVRRGENLTLYIDRLWQGQRDKDHQIMAAHVPMLLHPDPRRVAVVGVGVGQTASRFLMYPVERVDCVDIEPAIFPFIAAQFDATWLSDPRVRVVADDGRTFIAHGRGAYDLISVEVGQTFRPGVEAFYTREFYRDARARLREGGILAQFVPLDFLDATSLRRIVATFLEAFPRAVLWYNTSELLLIGGDRLRLDPARLALVETDPRLRAELAYSQWGGEARYLDHLGAFLGGFLCGRDALVRLAGGAEPLRDDRPVLAYATAAVREENMNAAPLAALIARLAQPVGEALDGAVSPAVLSEAATVQRLNLADISSAAHRHLGEKMRDGGDVSGAIAELQTAQALNPESIEVTRLLADATMQAGRTDRAVSLYRRALEGRPGDLLVQRGLAGALLRLGQAAEAEALLRPVAQQRPNDAQAWNTLGAALAGQRKFAEAAACFRRALAIDPQDASAAQNLQRASRAAQGGQ